MSPEHPEIIDRTLTRLAHGKSLRDGIAYQDAYRAGIAWLAGKAGADARVPISEWTGIQQIAAIIALAPYIKKRGAGIIQPLTPTTGHFY